VNRAPTDPGTEPLSASRQAALWGTGAAFLGLVALAMWGLTRVTALSSWPAHAVWATDLSTPLNWLMWLVGDTNEAQFYKSSLAGIGMTFGVLAAWGLLRAGRRAAGIPITYGNGLIGWILAASWISLVLANVGWQWTITDEFVWQPTFVTFVSVSSAVVLVYGRGWATALTAAVLGAALTTPIAIVVVDHVCVPLELPSVVGNVLGMSIGGLIAFAVCRVLPWMTLPADDAPTGQDPEEAPAPNPTFRTPGRVLRRALADFTEPQFYGNEWASLGLLAGVVLEFCLNPASPVYGSGVLPGVITAQFISAVLGVLLFRSAWERDGFYPTFIPIVSVAPALVVTFGSSPLVVVSAGVLGALVCPKLGEILARVLPKDFHPFIAYVFTMAVSCAVLVPVLKVVPGFGA
jgi:hypothetical protein